MFWRDRERDTKELNSGPLCGQVRVVVVGDSGTILTCLYVCNVSSLTLQSLVDY